MSSFAVLDHDAVLRAVTPERAIAETRTAFVRHRAGEWQMPPKQYVSCPPNGDFRAMPALGGGLAMLKWICSFPANVGTGVPTVDGMVCLSDATNGQPLLLLDAKAVTALRTGAVAAVAALELGAKPPADAVAGVVGCGFHGAWTARCLAAAGFRAGTCTDPNTAAAEALAAELGWAAGSLADALAADVVSCVTPGSTPVVTAADLRPGLHLNMLGADGSGKAEATIDVVTRCRLFCDEWEQASHGGELAGAVEAGEVRRSDVTDLGAVLSGEGGGRRSPEEITLFDSTGLAIQDLAIAAVALGAWRAGEVDAPIVTL